MKTTDNQNELFDVVDVNDKVVGQTTRLRANSNKDLIHRSIYVAVFNRKGGLYMQQRSESKDTDPLAWTISCSGHVISGDTYENAAKRELWEELGVRLDLEYRSKILVRLERETEMSVIYFAYSDGPFRLHPEEIKKGRFFTKKDLKKEAEKGEIKISASGECVLSHINWI